MDLGRGADVEGGEPAGNAKQRVGRGEREEMVQHTAATADSPAKRFFYLKSTSVPTFPPTAPLVPRSAVAKGAAASALRTAGGGKRGINGGHYVSKQEEGMGCYDASQWPCPNAQINETSFR